MKPGEHPGETPHGSMSAWAAEHLVDAAGGPLDLQPWQREILDRLFGGRGTELVITTPRGPDRERTSLAAAASVMEFGDVIVVNTATSRAQARRVYAEARRLVRRGR